MKSITLLLLVVTLGVCATPPIEERCALPTSPPFVYLDHSPGTPPPGRKLDASAVTALQTLLTNNLRRLSRPVNLLNPGGPPITPEKVIQIVDHKGTNHSQVLLLPGLLHYSGDFATQDKKVIAEFLKIVAPPKRQRSNPK